MQLTLLVEREEDGRWIAEVPEIPGILVYGQSRADALARAEVLALRVLAERIEQAEAGPQSFQIILPVAA